MVRVDVVAGQPPPPAACPPPAPLGPHDMYCSPYGEFYSQDPYYVPPPEMCPQPPHLCTLHSDYGPVMPMGVPGQQQGSMGVPVQVPSGHMVQQIMDESGNVRHVFLSPQPPPPPNHLPPHLQHPPPQNHQHPPQHYGPSNGANGHQQSYYQIPPGYPPPHYHPPPMGPPPSHHHMAPPSPPHPYHKDERTQRQHAKLRKKLDQKQRNDGLGFNSGHSTPALSPRKEFSNGRYRAAGGGGSMGVGGGGGGSMVGGTSSEGEGGSSAATSVQGDEEDSLPLLDYLSSLQTPHVSEVTARSALVQWSPPRLEGVPPVAPPPCGELRYELLLGDKGRYKAIYGGPSLSCRVQDLRPGTEYSLCLQARSEGVTGSASAAAVVRTAPAEPTSPAAPRAAQRTRASLQLRWQPPHDNGASIQSYVLQYDEGKGGDFVDLCNTRMKQHHLQKLEASTRYRFRLAAINDVGQGPWSEEVAFTTCGYPPLPPAPPTLENCQSHALTLYWDRRPGDDTFTLQMEDADHAAQHGFIAAYNGREVEARCEGLTRYSNYVFRLQAHNEDGGSQWSEEVTYRTLPERPGAPSKPVLKGKKHTQSFRVRWEPPVDKGGTEIELYTLEMKSEAEFQVVYTGIEQEVTCDRLQPGQTYHLRVCCTTGGGLSGWSDIQSITTEPTVPGACLRPQLLGEPRPHSISLRWSKPDYDGGSPILEYNVELSQQENSRLVYKGVETECTVHELLPGRLYSFKVKAFSRAGGGLWSEALEVTSGAAPPEPPQFLAAVAKSPFSIQVKWAEAPCNGGPITDYRLEMSLPNDQDNSFSQIFNGLHHSHDVKSLTPFTKYVFRVCAINKAGQSAWSEERSVSTPAAVPAAPPTLRAEATACDASLAWQEPDCNGSSISHYRIDLGERVFLTQGPVLEYQIDKLLPETTYKVRIQAVNEIGTGNYSPTLKFETLPPPPPPPILQCVQQGHNFLKLKWGDGKNPDFTQYIVEMQSPRRKEYQVVYQGTSLSFRVKKLQECTQYKFRVCAHNDSGGQGEYSEPVAWETTPAPPITLKAPRQVELTENSSLIEWLPPKGMSEEPLTFIVQCCRTKDMDYKQVYRGLETSMKIEELEGGCEYLVRVCAEREVQGRPLQGAWSPVLGLSPPAPPSLPPAPAPPSLTAAPRRSTRKSTAAPMTDHQWAGLFVFGFLCVAIFSVMAVKHFIDWHTSV